MRSLWFFENKTFKERPKIWWSTYHARRTTGHTYIQPSKNIFEIFGNSAMCMWLHNWALRWLWHCRVRILNWSNMPLQSETARFLVYTMESEWPNKLQKTPQWVWHHEVSALSRTALRNGNFECLCEFAKIAKSVLLVNKKPIGMEWWNKLEHENLLALYLYLCEN